VREPVACEIDDICGSRDRAVLERDERLCPLPPVDVGDRDDGAARRFLVDECLLTLENGVYRRPSPSPPTRSSVATARVQTSQYSRQTAKKDRVRRRLALSTLNGARLLMRRPAVLFGLGAVLLVVGFQLWITPSNPPGFHRDEAALSYNAYSISTTLRDEDEGVLPLFFRSFDDYKSPLYPYLLAGVFRITGPDPQVARGLSAVLGLVAVLLLGLLAKRLTASAMIGVVVLVLAGVTPWLFELGRVAIEATTQPLLIASLLLVLLRAWHEKTWTAREGVVVGVVLGLLLYSYTGNRLLAPLLAAGLVVFAGRGRWRWLSAAWTSFAAFLLLLGVYHLRHPGALTARYSATSIARDEPSWPGFVLQAIANWFHDINPWFWATSGDAVPYIHNGGYGSVYAAVVALAITGCVIVLTLRWDDLWWRYVLLALLLAPVPAALTVDRHTAVRLAALPVLGLVLAIPGLEALVGAARRRWIVAFGLGALALTVAFQFVQFLDAYRTRGPARTVLFEAGIKPLLEQAFRTGNPIYIDYDDRGAQAEARWRAAAADLPSDRVRILPDGGIPPRGSLVFGRFQECDYVCRKFARWEHYWLATAIGPRSG
jgi:Dolichyl-phosphate-mannose-protein mannosyltransferase